MSLSFSTLCSPSPSPSLYFPSYSRLFTGHRTPVTPFRSCPNRIKLSNTERGLSFSKKKLEGFSFEKMNFLGFAIKAEIGGGGEKKNVVGDEAENEARGQSTMPERFRYLTQEAPDPPVRWPYFVALAFLIYAWRTVLWELYNWKKAVGMIFQFLGYLSKLALALVFHFIGDPITSSIRGIETAIYTFRALYSGIVSYTPIPELTMIIILASTVFAIAEATVPDSVSRQPYLLTVAGLTGFAAVKGFISEPFFWTLLVGFFGFARLVKKRNYVSSALPVAAVLAAVGEPWVRVVVMALYLALAIIHHSNKPSEAKEVEPTESGRRVPIPLLCAALAIGVRVAAKWAGYRHLTWMIV